MKFQKELKIVISSYIIRFVLLVFEESHTVIKLNVLFFIQKFSKQIIKIRTTLMFDIFDGIVFYSDEIEQQ